MNSFPAGGGSGTVAVTTDRECTWSIASEAAWIVPDRAEGQGGANLSFRVAPNTSANSRRGALVLESTRLEVTQEGAPCRFDLDASRVEIGASGGSAQVTVAAMAECSWAARALDSWIAVVRGASGSGTGVIELAVAPNTGAARQGSLTVAGQTVAVAQQGAPAPAPTPPAPTPPPPAPPPPAPTPPPPAPPPPPPPTPTPRPGERVELTGRVSSLNGACPTLRFVVAGTAVYADRATDYRGGNCRHVEEGQRVVVVGERQPDLRIHAQDIDLRQRNRD